MDFGELATRADMMILMTIWKGMSSWAGWILASKKPYIAGTTYGFWADKVQLVDEGEGEVS